MAINTPRLNIIDVFDVTEGEHTFSFSYSGTQVVKNRLVIKDNNTLAEVYNVIQDGLKLSHTISSSDIACLQNNKVYIAQVQVYDANDNSSNLSDPVIFTCHALPSFSFNDLATENIISSENIATVVSFSQSEGDKISELIYCLYDENKNELYKSNTYHEIVTYTYYGLKNNESYYIRAIGKSIYGFSLDTGYKKIIVKAKTKTSNINFVADNIDGKILFSTNLIITDCTAENDNYYFEDGKVYIYDNSITYHVKNTKDFSLVIKSIEIPMGVFAKVFCDSGLIELSTVSISDRYYCKLSAKNSLNNYLLYEDITEMININNSGRLEVNDLNKCIVFEVHKKDGLYLLNVKYQ